VASVSEETEYVLLKGKLSGLQIHGHQRNKRLTAWLEDETGVLELIWFQGVSWLKDNLLENANYLVWGKVSFFGQKIQIAHPEIELSDTSDTGGRKFLEPVYPSTEKLKARGMNNRALGKLTSALLAQITPDDIVEPIPKPILEEIGLMMRYEALCTAHFPPDIATWQKAIDRLKFEELFLAQMRLAKLKSGRKQNSKGFIFQKIGTLFNNFFENQLPFPLTNAQKKVVREIRQDMATGYQMNRLLQGDVGSGKTIVALLVMLIAADNGFQSCLMAPTEILARQHYSSLKELTNNSGIEIDILTGSTKQKERKILLQRLRNGQLHVLVGTHAVLEDQVHFHQLGLAVIDEQHRFGVEQRSKLWAKTNPPPHILVMTATPIPRTLAMSLYGDLDYSIIDELPPGRKPIQTVHRYDHKRTAVMDFVKDQIKLGRQAYIIYPLIEESEKLSYENLMQGYEQVKTFFPEHLYSISMVHGRMKAEMKDLNMQRFMQNQTQILVGTTVIEVGVNVPNASVMVIESAEKFGLSTLHQLRGRVGRGAEKSFCILLTPFKVSKDAKQRMSVMTTTSDGFLIAEKDLELRGPGDMEGTRQSGALNFKLSSIVNDKEWIMLAKKFVDRILIEDGGLVKDENTLLRICLEQQMVKNYFSHIS
jgi:ATP-dependent DNA helicase RecG